MTAASSNSGNSKYRIGIVASRYNGHIVDRLIDGCMRTLNGAGVDADHITLVRVPGAFEIPVAAARLAGLPGMDAVIALGVVIRGETSHFDYIAGECARGLGMIAVQTGLPVSFGVLTVENTGQALDRSGDDESNKGSEAAATALQMIDVMRGLDA